MFDSRRFLRLASAHWAEYKRTYAWFIGIGIMVHFILLLVMLASEGGHLAFSKNSQTTVYYCGLYLSGTLFAARYFQSMSRQESALIVLMRPSSAFEKWLLAFLFVGLFYPIAYTLAFYVCNLPGWLLFGLPWVGSAEMDSSLFFVVSVFDELKDLAGILLMLSILQALAVLGSVYFKKLAAMKTLLLAFFILLASIFTSAIFNNAPEVLFQYWFSRKVLAESQQAICLLMSVGVPMLLWLACYFALKEREVA